jgi:GNAT superfamily N-acetyltransferase
MSALIFRFADVGDIAELMGLRLRVDAEQALRFGRDRWTTKISEDSVARGLKTGRVLMALEDGKTVGAVRMESRKPWAIDLTYFTPVARAIYLHDVNIEPALQGRGLGRAMMDGVKSAARAWPVDGIRVDAYDGPAGAGPFYEKCGFRAVGRTIYRSVPLAYFELLLHS